MRIFSFGEAALAIGKTLKAAEAATEDLTKVRRVMVFMVSKRTRLLEDPFLGGPLCNESQSFYRGVQPHHARPHWTRPEVLGRGLFLSLPRRTWRGQ